MPSMSSTLQAKTSRFWVRIPLVLGFWQQFAYEEDFKRVARIHIDWYGSLGAHQPVIGSLGDRVEYDLGRGVFQLG